MIPARGPFYMAMAVPLLILVAMVVDRQILLSTGTEILLRTRPVDPRSLLSGDYVDLRLEIGEVAFEDPTEHPEVLLAGSRAYVTLAQGPEGVWRATGVSPERPADGVFLRGQVLHAGNRQGKKRVLSILYGLESWYVKEGEGKALERVRTLDVTARVSPSGVSAVTAVRPGG